MTGDADVTRISLISRVGGGSDQAAWCFAPGPTGQANELALQAIELQRETLGDDHPDLAHSLFELADIAKVLAIAHKRRKPVDRPRTFPTHVTEC
jgi:hypothetical protein